MKMNRKLYAIVLILSLSLSASMLALAAEKKGNKSPSNKSASTAKVNINTANAEQLTSLSGVGPALAQRIVEHRTKNGNFKKIEDIMSVKGIGEKKFLKIKDRLTI